MNEGMISEFREKLAAGQAVIGPFMKTGDPAFVEGAGYAGFDFVILDMEHGPVGPESMQNNVRAAQLAGVLPVIRVPAVSEEAIGKALDIGAAAIEIPQITNGRQAAAAVKMARFYPQGERGVCRFVRAAHYSAQHKNSYFEAANQSLIIAQLEGREAIRNLDEILQVEGIDIIFIGPYDLSQSLGVPGETTHLRVTEAMEKIVIQAKRHGATVGTFTDSLETMDRWKRAGVQYISYSVDVGIFYQACAGLVADFRKIKF